MDLTPFRCLVETEWLAEHLNEPDIRVIECTSLLPNYFEASAADGLLKESGRSLYDEAHIPGSAFADILGELSDPDNPDLMYGVPSAERFAAVMSRLGIDDNSAVVLYDRNMNMWAARVWMLLRAFGFDNTAVLNGGWTQWTAERRPTSAAPASYAPAHFLARPRPGVIARIEDVKNAITDDSTCLINALHEDEFVGRPPQRYARSGRIPGSVSLPFLATADLETQRYVDDSTLKSQLDEIGAGSADEVICYCGGGIAACSTALLLTRLGRDKVAVYDGSMQEWAADPALPMETG